MTYHSKRKQRIYAAIPYPFKILLATVYGAQQRRARYSTVFRETWRDLQASQRSPADAIKQYERETLGAFLADVLPRTRYYREHPVYRVDAELGELPVLSKSTVQAQLPRFYRDGSGDGPCHWGHTSGTTGQALVFPISEDCFQREYAFRVLHYSWGGVDFAGRDRHAFCSGHPVAHHDRRRPPFWVHDVANNWLLLSSYNLTEQNLPAYVRKLEKYNPVMLGGYPSSLYLLALAYRKYGRGTLRPRAVFTASETLFDRQREVMREAFGAPVFNWYGNSELCGHITECEAGRLHVRHEHSYVEVLDDRDAPCAPGETGRLVATGFHNRLFPLIRYDVGDRVTLSAEAKCPCGRTGRLIERIEGRQEDYVATPDGRLVGRLDHLFKDTLHVREAQIVQSCIEAIVLRIVKSPDYGAGDEEEIVRQARLRLGSTIRIVFEYVEFIERSPSGKYRFIVSKLDQQALLSNLSTP
jgi:phenylacetate-CoA ligase